MLSTASQVLSSAVGARQCGAQTNERLPDRLPQAEAAAPGCDEDLPGRTVGGAFPV